MPDPEQGGKCFQKAVIFCSRRFAIEVRNAHLPTSGGGPAVKIASWFFVNTMFLMSFNIAKNSYG